MKKRPLDAEAQFRLIVEAIPQIVFAVDKDGKGFVNQRWREYTGITYDSVNADLAWQELIHPDDRKQAVDAWLSATAPGTPYAAEYRLRGRDGAYRWHLLQANYLVMPGETPRWLGTLTDIHEQRIATEELARRTAALERSNVELEQFAYITSHDLKEPLRMVSAYTQLLERGLLAEGALDQEKLEYMQYVVMGTRRMSRLIDDLLVYSRAGRHGEQMVEVDAEQAFLAARENLQLAIEESGALVTHGPLPRVRANRVPLAQVFQNLVGNALKYRKPDRRPEIRVEASREESFWHFRVSDNGIGIEPRFFERIFVIFQRLHAREKYEGTGVGLAVCRRIVGSYGGKIWVESEPGRGSVFHFTLPV